MARAVQSWIKRYNDGGVEGLQEGDHSGKPPRHKAGQEEKLKARLDAGALPADGVCTLQSCD